MKIRNITIILTIQLLIFLYCSPKKRSPFIEKMIKKGVQVIQINETPESEEPLYNYKIILSLGGENPTPILFQPKECLVDENENLYFSDEGRIKKFDAYGHFLCFVGNKGEGPGEINWPSLEQVMGDSLIVGQKYRWSGQRRYVIFKNNGEFLKLIYYPIIKKRLFPKGKNYLEYFLGDNIFLFRNSQNEKREKGIYYSKDAYGLTTSEGAVIKELDFFMDEYTKFIQQEGAGMARPLTMTKNEIFFKNYLYILSRNGRDVFVYTAKGDLIKILQLKIDGVKITNSDKKKITSTEKEPKFLRLIRAIGFPDRKPAVCDIIVDDKYRIWLKKGDTFGQAKSQVRDYTYMIISKEGKYLSDQLLPIDLTAVKGNNAYGFITTEDDLRIFKKLELFKN